MDNRDRKKLRDVKEKLEEMNRIIEEKFGMNLQKIPVFTPEIQDILIKMNREYYATMESLPEIWKQKIIKNPKKENEKQEWNTLFHQLQSHIWTKIWVIRTILQKERRE